MHERGECVVVVDCTSLFLSLALFADGGHRFSSPSKAADSSCVFIC